MSKNNPLLQTLIESPNPEPIAMWPQTLGWKVIGLTALCLLGYASVKAYQTWRKNEYKRLALKQLKELEASEEDCDTKGQTLNRILKNVAAESYGHESVAALHGTSWGGYLIACCEAEIDRCLINRWQSSLYEPNPKLGTLDIDLLISWARVWVTNHSTEAPNTIALASEVQND